MRDRLLKDDAARRQDLLNAYYWDMGIRDVGGDNVKELTQAYQQALGEDTAKYFQEKKTQPPVAEADCRMARTPTEKVVCSNPQLQMWDRTMAESYHQAFARSKPNSAGRAELIADQRKWLKSLDACKADAACLERAYRLRARTLSDWPQR
ncbi:lysozyme inhibitor LprI family protein [Acidithiobacillus sp. IBUN Pt1247-S3]|uniref:lysozyme inhibitor LprI family protein n=1 Tax=Acidithiobacillus sp. IBUN Pt1247-S3 TaxID=3166642 RepID=UPI0034E58C60